MALPSSFQTSTLSSIEEIVFSCSVCQATLSDVYATVESNKGFHDGHEKDDGIVTKLWMAECSHVTCAKHLGDGGESCLDATYSDMSDRAQGVPLHPNGSLPRASCPRCMQSGDDSLKSLYGIRGLAEGQCDPIIPAEWRQCPASKLDDEVPDMSGVRVCSAPTRVSTHSSLGTVPVHGDLQLCPASALTVAKRGTQVGDLTRAVLHRSPPSRPITVRATQSEQEIRSSESDGEGAGTVGGA